MYISTLAGINSDLLHLLHNYTILNITRVAIGLRNDPICPNLNINEYIRRNYGVVRTRVFIDQDHDT